MSVLFFFVRLLVVFSLVDLHAPGGEDDNEMMANHVFRPVPETEDAFLVKLNQRNVGPSDYASALLVEHSLNRQQILQLRSPSGAALCERLCVKVPVEASVCKSICVCESVCMYKSLCVKVSVCKNV